MTRLELSSQLTMAEAFQISGAESAMLAAESGQRTGTDWAQTGAGWKQVNSTEQLNNSQVKNPQLLKRVLFCSFERPARPGGERREGGKLDILTTTLLLCHFFLLKLLTSILTWRLTTNPNDPTLYPVNKHYWGGITLNFKILLFSRVYMPTLLYTVLNY